MGRREGLIASYSEGVGCVNHPARRKEEEEEREREEEGRQEGGWRE